MDRSFIFLFQIVIHSIDKDKPSNQQMKAQNVNMAIQPQQMNMFADFIQNTIQPQPIGVSPLTELQLRYDSENHKDIRELKQILGQCLSYPSTQLAKIHMKANRLGQLDLKSSELDPLLYNQNYKQLTENATFCPCCGFILQDQTLGICTNMHEVNHMGISTYLYFETLKNVIFLLMVMLIVFSVYSLVSNVIASDSYKVSLSSSSNVAPALLSYEGFLAISLGSKQIHETQSDKISYTAQCWLGVAVIVIWGIAFALIKNRERVSALEIDRDNKTASDFTILIKNFPSRMTKQQLEAQLQEYRTNLGSISYEGQVPIKVTKINKAKPFYLNEQSFNSEKIENLNKEYETFRETFIEWIMERREYSQFLTPENQRKKKIKQFNQLRESRLAEYKNIAQKIREDFKKKQAEETVPTFVTFESSYNKEFLELMHDDQTRLISRLPCFNRDRYFRFKRIGSSINVVAQIRQAPQPEDIIWTNQGQETSSIIKKKLFTYSISALVLAASFGAIYGLSKVQFDYAKTHVDISNQYISILISLCISIINIIIQQILRFLTKIERSATNTQHQTSLGLKAVFALLINSILIPILVNYFFKENLYGVNGLAYDVFYLGITNSFLSPLLKIFDVYYLFTRLWRRFKTKPPRKLSLNQNELNIISEYMQFQIGYEYIYYVNLFLFTCFFSPLQPIIVVFAIAGLTLMYWAQKYSLFQRCKRPTPGNNSINTTMYQLIYLGPAFFTIGSFCWSHFFKQSFIGIAPNLTAAILSGIIFLIPYKRFAKYFFAGDPEAQEFYEADRIFMPSEYDRLNPTTSAEGIHDYKEYLARYKANLEMNKNAGQSQAILKWFYMQNGAGNRKYEPIAPSIVNYLTPRGGAFSDNGIVLQELMGTGQNTFNPYLIGRTIFDTGNPISMVVPNWLTQEQQNEVVTYQQNDPRKHPNPLGTMFSDKKMAEIMGTVIKKLLPTVEVDHNGNMVLVHELIKKQDHGPRGNKLQPLGDREVEKIVDYQVPMMPINMLGSLCIPGKSDRPAQNNKKGEDVTYGNGGKGTGNNLNPDINRHYGTNNVQYQTNPYNNGTMHSEGPMFINLGDQLNTGILGQLTNPNGNPNYLPINGPQGNGYQSPLNMYGNPYARHY